MNMNIPTSGNHLAGSYENLSAQGQQYLRTNQYDKAQEIYERLYNRLNKIKTTLIERRPNLKTLKLTSLRILADLAGLQGEYDKAISYYETGLEINPEESLLYRQAIARMKIDKGDTEAGLDELRALAISNSGEANVWITLGVELWGHNDQDEAISSLTRATELTGAEPNQKAAAYSYLHDLYREQDRLAEAEEAWREAWHVSGREIEDVSPLYQMYYEAGDLEKARFWLKQESNPLRAGFYRGLFDQAEGAERRAHTAWKKTVDLAPLGHEEGHEAWAEAALRINHPPRTIIYILNEAANRNLINIRGLLFLAVAQIRADQVSRAEITLQSAVEINQRARPRKDLLSKGHWDLFDELVTDEGAKERCKAYFETEDGEAEAVETEAVETEVVETEAE